MNVNIWLQCIPVFCSYELPKCEVHYFILGILIGLIDPPDPYFGIFPPFFAYGSLTVLPPIFILGILLLYSIFQIWKNLNFFVFLYFQIYKNLNFFVVCMMRVCERTNLYD